MSTAGPRDDVVLCGCCAAGLEDHRQARTRRGTLLLIFEEQTILRAADAGESV